MCEIMLFEIWHERATSLFACIRQTYLTLVTKQAYAWENIGAFLTPQKPTSRGIRENDTRYLCRGKGVHLEDAQ